jgi:hypothetical protein
MRFMQDTIVVFWVVVQCSLVITIFSKRLRADEDGSDAFV